MVTVQAITGELSAKDEHEIDIVANQPPCFVVYGDSVHAKAAVINRLFQREILPSSSVPKRRWRTIRFRYGSKTRVTQKSDDYVAAKKLKSLASLPLSQNHIEESDILDNMEGVSVGPPDSVDVQLNDPLLAAGARVTVTCSGDSDWSNEQVYNFCTEGVCPIIIYAVSSSSFNEQVSFSF